ncbi:hypothetical protein BKA69DRAFT_1099153 [Paraphysoderma sedebokerense]|nr:hypothetical protein BKA69DRAFT_1099153 [Paraphysoderma sedebokerense]
MLSLNRLVFVAAVIVMMSSLQYVDAANRGLGDCVMCPQVVPTCPPCAHDETCQIKPQSCHSCASAGCIKRSTKGKNVTDPSDMSNCVVCAMVWMECPVCAADEECVRTSISCRECPKVYCAKVSNSTSSSTVSGKLGTPTSTPTSESAAKPTTAVPNVVPNADAKGSGASSVIAQGISSLGVALVIPILIVTLGI